MMVTSPMRRKAFRAALGAAEKSFKSWCTDTGVGYHHASLVIMMDPADKRKRNSKRLDAEVDAFIHRTLFPFVDEYRKRVKASK